jgi:hypothetical protein
MPSQDPSPRQPLTIEKELSVTAKSTTSVSGLVDRVMDGLRLTVLGVLLGIGLAVGFGVGAACEDVLLGVLSGTGAMVAFVVLVRVRWTRKLLAELADYVIRRR